MVAFETDRLILRDWEQSDWRDAQKYASDPQVCRFMVWGPNADHETRDFIRQAIDDSKDRPRRVFELAIALKENQSVIGGFGLRVTGAESATAMIGYVLNRGYWGQGLVTEATEEMIKKGFTEFDLHRIYATCDTKNTASRRIMEKCGMRREAHFRQDCYLKGEWRDTYVYAILESEWREQYESS